jgi:hypothetical protein
VIIVDWKKYVIVQSIKNGGVAAGKRTLDPDISPKNFFFSKTKQNGIGNVPRYVENVILDSTQLKDKFCSNTLCYCSEDLIFHATAIFA